MVAAAEVSVSSDPSPVEIGRAHGSVMRAVGASTDRALRVVRRLDHGSASTYDHQAWIQRASELQTSIADLTTYMEQRVVVMEEPLPDRPHVRGDCEGGPRPCPWIDCRYHLYFDVAHVHLGVPKSGLRRFKDDTLVEVLWLMDHTCVLDATRQGERTLEEIGRMFGLTRERVRQLEERATLLFPRAIQRLGLRDIVSAATVEVASSSHARVAGDAHTIPGGPCASGR